MGPEAALEEVDGGTGVESGVFSVELKTIGTGIVVLLTKLENESVRAHVNVAETAPDGTHRVTAAAGVDVGPKVELFIFNEIAPKMTSDELDDIIHM